MVGEAVVDAVGVVVRGAIVVIVAAVRRSGVARDIFGFCPEWFSRCRECGCVCESDCIRD